MKAYKLDDERRANKSRAKKKLNVFRTTSCLNKSLKRTKKVITCVWVYAYVYFFK